MRSNATDWTHGKHTLHPGYTGAGLGRWVCSSTSKVSLPADYSE
jgi:hypothetical protein